MSWRVVPRDAALLLPLPSKAEDVSQGPYLSAPASAGSPFSPSPL